MDDKKLNELKMGEDVTVITKGDYQLIDVANGIRIPPKTECTLPLSGFVMDQLVMGNLTVAGEDDAPEATGEKLEGVDALRYPGARDTAESRSSATEDAFSTNFKRGRDTAGPKDEIPQGGRTGRKGTSQAHDSKE
jgi:hypothetical protein